MSTETCEGQALEVAVSFGSITEKMDCLFEQSTPFSVVIECPALESMEACTDLVNQLVRFRKGENH